MAIDALEILNDQQATMLEAINGTLSGLWTAMPGIIQSFDADAVTAVVQPAIQAFVNQQDGTTLAVNLPLLPDVPVIFPRGGGCTLTFPVAAGDECLVVFSSRCIDAWWQSGGVQIPMDQRKHDLSDGFALVGPMSQARKIGSISTSNAQLRSDDGSTYFELNPSAQLVNIVAPGGVVIDAPYVITTGDQVVMGLLSYMNGMVGSGGSGSTASINGSVKVTGGDVTADGIGLKPHKHTDSIGGTTSPAKP